MFDPIFTHASADREVDVYLINDELQRHANEKGSYAAYSYYFAIYPKITGAVQIDGHWTAACIFSHFLLVLWKIKLRGEVSSSELLEIAIERMKVALEKDDRGPEFWFTKSVSHLTPQEILSQLKDGRIEF